MGPITNGQGLTGFDLDVHAACLSVGNPSTGFVTAEAWIYTPSTNKWIEAGQAVGNPKSNDTPYFFWADSRGFADDLYHEHDYNGTAPNSANSYDTFVSKDDSSTFYVGSGPDQSQTVNWGSNTVFEELQSGSETGPLSNNVNFWDGEFNMTLNDASNVHHTQWNFAGQSVHHEQFPSSWGNVTTVDPDSHYQEDGGQIHSC